MTKLRRNKISTGELGAYFSNLDNVSCSLGEAAEELLKVEILMRMIAEVSEPVREELKKNAGEKAKAKKGDVEEIWKDDLNFLNEEINLIKEDEKSFVNEGKQKSRLNSFQSLKNKIKELSKLKEEDKKYYRCNPSLLSEAIISVFENDLTTKEKGKIKYSVKIRGKLFHGLFVDLLKVLNIKQTSRVIGASGIRLELEKMEIFESLSSLMRNDGPAKARRIAVEVTEILKKILYLLSK